MVDIKKLKKHGTDKKHDIKKNLENKWISFGRILSVRLSDISITEQIKLSWKLILTIFSSPGIRTQTEIIRKVCFQIYYTFLALFFAFLCVYLNTFARTLSKQVYNTASYQRKNKLHRFFRLLFQWILFYFFIFFRISFQ